MKTSHFSWLVAISMFAACSSDPGAPLDRSADAGQDMTADALDMSPRDQATDTPDQRSPADMAADQQVTPEDLGARDAGSTMDAGQGDMSSEQDMQDLGSEDMSVMPDLGTNMDDMSSQQDMSAYADRARGDCVASSDCGSADLFCERGAVGGTCTGPCPACDDIPGPNTHQCIAGACVPECDDDTDCSPGRSCNMRRGVCQVERCTGNVCPVPWFGCSEPDGICVRVPCDSGQVCPSQTQCDGQYCIEDHAAP